MHLLSNPTGPPEGAKPGPAKTEAMELVGNDSGVSHLSAILGTKTLALFKGQNYAQWGVRGRDAHSLEAANEAQAMTRIQKALQA